MKEDDKKPGEWATVPDHLRSQVMSMSQGERSAFALKALGNTGYGKAKKRAKNKAARKARKKNRK